MDRIKKALDKSRAERKHQRREVPLREVEYGKSSEETQPFENIHYSQTRSIDVSQSQLAENRLVAGNRTDPRATAFRILRTQVLQAMRENGWITLGITGPTSGVGKSLVSANLAVSISFEVNQTVLLVDADLRRPSVHKYFNYQPELGLVDYLTGQAALPELLVNPVFKRLVLLPGRGSSSESSELLSSPRMGRLVKELRSKYESRIVIYDLPPVLDIDDALVFLPNLDATLLVVENGKNTQSEVQGAMRLLESTNLIGTVLNKADEDIRDYY
jgi:capsular exopolysaccharide synthesis family protein